MYRRPHAIVLLIVLNLGIDNASADPAMPFVDGRWRGDIENEPDSGGFRECWASTTFDDGTTLTLAEREDGNWYLRLSNPGWRLPPTERYDTIALVDYPPQQVPTTAEVKSETQLEIANLEQISLLRLIENGHMINLAYEDSNETYDLEGSAKAIQRIRNCFADHSQLVKGL